MTPGIIKKLYHTTAVGLADEEKQEVYPITATGAVYSPAEASSFPSMRLDQILDALNEGYLYIGVASPSTNPGTYNHKVFYLASEAGTYSYFGDIQVSGLTVLKNSGSGWVKEELHISGGGGGGTDLAAVWGSLTKTTVDAYANTKIHFDHIPSLFTLRTPIIGTAANGTLLGVDAISNAAASTTGSNDLSRIEWDDEHKAWHFYGNLYTTGWNAAGGIGTGGGGGTDTNTWRGISVNGTLFKNNDITSGPINIKAGSNVTLSTSGNDLTINATGGGPATGVVKSIDVAGDSVTPDANGVASITTALNSHLNWWSKEYITVTRHYALNEGTRLATISIGSTNPRTIDIWAPNGGTSGGIVDVTLGGTSVVSGGIAALPAYPTESTVSGWGFTKNAGTVTQVKVGTTPYNPSSGVVTLPAYPTETTVSEWGFTKNTGTVSQIKIGTTSYNPSSGVVSLPAYPTTLPASDVSSWAKQTTKPSYTFSELTAHPTTLSGYGITDAKISNGVITLGNNTITPLTSHQAISTLTLNSGSFVSGTWTPTGSGKTFNIPTTTSHLSHNSSTLKAFLDDLPNNYVTLGTSQTITGAKTFSDNPVTIAANSGISINGSSYIDIGNARLIYDSASNALHVTKKTGATGTVGLYADGSIASGGAVGASNIPDELNYDGRLYIQHNSQNLCLTTGGKTIVGSYDPSVIGNNKLTVMGTAIATTWNTTSDVRLKENISYLTKSEAIDKLMSLKPATWKWNSGVSKGCTASGFIAQEVEPIIPFMVTGEDYKGLAYQMLHAYEVSAIQSHEERIKQLEMENEFLRSKIC